MKKKLAMTKRPLLARSLCWVVAGCGLMILAEGILLAWSLGHMVPPGWKIDSLRIQAPWLGSWQWIAGTCLIIIGIAGVLAGLSLAKQPLGTYLSLFLMVTMIAVGIILLYVGIRFEAPIITAWGALDVAAGLVVATLLGLCWYTLDPLGLHWDPEEGII